VDEFLDKLQEDQRRMRKFLRSRGLRFKKMGEILAGSRSVGSRVFLLGEPPLDQLVHVIAEEYLTHLPVLPVDLSRPAPPSVDPDESGEPAVGRAAAAKQTGRHLHSGDMLLALVFEGDDRETRMVLEAARARRIPILVVGGLGAKGHMRRLAKVRVNLPTRGIKTICESMFVCARILARISRAAWREAADGADGGLVQVVCDTCCEKVFLDEALRGKRAECPLCRARVHVPRSSSRRLPAPSIAEARPATEPAGRKRRRPPKPSVLEFEAPRLGDSDDFDEEEEADIERAAARVKADLESDGEADFDLDLDDDDEAAFALEEDEEEDDLDEDEEEEEEEEEEDDLEEDDLEEDDLEEDDLEEDDLEEDDLEEDEDEDDLDEGDLDEDGEGRVGLEEDGGRKERPSVERAAVERSDSASSAPPSPAESFQEPVGLVSHEPSNQGPGLDGPSFGSEIVVGSDLVSAPGPGKGTGKKGVETTASADPYALEDAFLADLEMPKPGKAGESSASSQSDEAAASRRLSSRYTIAECKLRWGRGGFPDESSPEHELVNLSTGHLEFFLDPDDEAGSTLQKGDELWARIEIPAFLEPILVRGTLRTITGTSGSGGRGARLTLDFIDLDPTAKRKLARAAENVGAPA